MYNNKYIVKNLTPWMVDELTAFSNFVKFDLILLRKPDEFYAAPLKRIETNGVNIIITPYSNNLFNKKKLNTALKFLFKNLSRFRSKYNFIIGIKSIIWFLKLDLKKFSNRSNIHAQFATQASILSLLIKDYYKGDPLFSFTFHAYDIYYNNHWFDLMIDYCHKAFSISEFNINYVIKNYKPSDKIVLSRLGVFRHKINMNKKKKENFSIGLLSWFVEKKGIIYLLEAMKIIKEKGESSIRLTLAGDGPLKKTILNYIETNDLQSTVKYKGKLKSSEKDDFFNSLDIFVLPSIKLHNDQDGIPVVLMEAIAYSLPLISTKISGIPEICVENFNGKLIEERNVNDLVQSILELSKNENEREKYSINSIKLSEKYDIDSNSKLKVKYLNWI